MDYTMLYRPASSRKSSLVVSAATAAVVFAGASMLATYPAMAGEPANKFAAECAPKKNATDHAVCIVGAMNKDTARLKADENRSRQEHNQAKALSLCYDFLIGKVNAGDTTKEEVVKRAGGNLNDANVCTVAGTYGRRAELKRPAL
jgi:flagellar basal body-associated protein FliL